MRWFANLKLDKKLFLLSGTTLLLTLIIAATAVYQTSHLSGAMREVTGNWLPSVQALLTLARSTTELRVRENRLLLKADDPEWIRATEAQIDEQLRTIATEQAAYAKFIANPEERALNERYRAAWDDYLVVLKQVRALADAGKRNEAMALMLGRGLEAYGAVSAALKASVTFNAEGAAREGAKVDALGSQTLVWIGSMAGIALVMGLLASFAIGRVITRPIGQAVHAAQALSKGDFTVVLPEPTADETGQLVAAMTHLRDDLGQVIADVRASATSVATASAQIASGTQDLSARTEQQAASLEETASAMDELSGTIRSAADVAQRTDDVARETSTSAERAGAAVTRVVATMDRIADGSRRIKDIIGVIDGIAFQTNILALNASVEAARAGEQGRGFAVVASEVRTLAQRSADAAREIKGLIETAGAQVDDGSTAAAEAGRTVGQVVAEIANVRSLVSEISTSAQQQSQGIAQVNEAVVLIDQGTQQNAALVEQSTAAAASLQTQAERLSQSVSTFRLP
jgi:methyl-accepting chemotaxis protein